MLGLHIEPFTPDDALTAAEPWPHTRERGLGLGDRARLALALRREEPVLTADRPWSGLSVGVGITLIR